MPTIKSAKAPLNTANSKLFSLVPAVAQQQMYKALTALKPSQLGAASGAEVAEIAVCLAIGENDPVILACPAPGACTVRKRSTIVGTKIKGAKITGAQYGKLAAATISAVATLFGDSKLTAVVCAGRLDAQEDYRSAFSFASRHKLPILFIVANILTPKRRQKIDLGTLYAEFGIPVFSVDALDAIAVYRVATEALHNARHMRGPCVIEALMRPSDGGSAGIAIDLLRDYMDRHGSWSL